MNPYTLGDKGENIFGTIMRSVGKNWYTDRRSAKNDGEAAVLKSRRSGIIQCDFEVKGHGTSFLVEVKLKQTTMQDKIEQYWYGVPLKNYEHYLKEQEISGMTAYLALIETGKINGKVEPKLLIQSISLLKKLSPRRYSVCNESTGFKEVPHIKWMRQMFAMFEIVNIENPKTIHLMHSPVWGDITELMTDVYSRRGLMCQPYHKLDNIQNGLEEFF